MVQIVENWSDVRGRVEAIEHASDGPPAPVLMKLRVQAAAPVSGYPNFLAEAVGKTISVRGPSVARIPRVGEAVRCRVRKASVHQYFYLADSLVVE